MSAPTSLRALALTLVLLGLTAASASAAVTFAPPAEYPAGGGDVQSMGVADFDGDGTPDVAVANEYAGIGGTDPGAYSILLGNADGTLDAPLSADLGEIFNSEMGVGDFNDDDRPDLVAGDSATDSLAATPNTGGGTFGPAVSSPFTGSGAEGMAVGDFDEDGEPDVAVGHSDDDAIHLLTGNGDGTFAQGPDHDFGFDNDPYALAAGDFDGDGHLDLAVGDDYAGTVTPLFGAGDGTFTAGDAIPITTGCGCDVVDSIAVADLDGDGNDDIVAGSNYDGRLLVLTSEGAGRDFTAVRKNVGAQPRKLALGDISGDGVPDLVMIDVDVYGSSPSPGPGRLVWMTGTGTGDFGAERSEQLSDYPATLALADVDGDDRLDAIAADEAGTVSVALNATGPTAAASPASLTFAEQPLSTVSAKQTVTVTNSDTQALHVSAVTPAGPDVDDLLVSETCTAKAIAPGASCTIGVRLIPSATGARSATIAIAHDGGGAALEVPVTGTGGALPAGPAGTNGTDGQDGANGQDGTDGTDGQDGAKGEPGAKGDTGAAGPAGPTGPAGSTGATGPIGPAGPQGTAGTTIERLMVVLADSRYTVRAGKRRAVAFGATLPGTATLTITKAKAKRASATIRRTLARAGASSITVPALKRGTYTLKLTYTARGTAATPLTARYTVRG